jgi:hypothetical protein
MWKMVAYSEEEKNFRIFVKGPFNLTTESKKERKNRTEQNRRNYTPA